MWKEWLSKILPPDAVEDEAQRQRTAPLRAPAEELRERIGEAEERCE